MKLSEVVLAAPLLKRVHVNGPKLRQAKKDGVGRPLFIVKCRGRSYPCVQFHCAGELLGKQSLEGMPGCRHAVAWLETTAAVTIVVAQDEEGDDE